MLSDLLTFVDAFFLSQSFPTWCLHIFKRFTKSKKIALILLLDIHVPRSTRNLQALKFFEGFVNRKSLEVTC